MNPYKLLIPFFLLVVTSTLAQKSSVADVTNVTKLTIFNPGLSYEQRIGKFQTIYGQVFMNTTVSTNTTTINNGNLFKGTTFYFDPAITLQYRFYYNAGRRERKGARTAMNSLNYIALTDEMTFSKAPIKSTYYIEKDRRAVNRIGFIWGMQRNFPKRFSIDFNLGAGYQSAKTTIGYSSAGAAIKKNYGSIAFLGQLNLGIWLNKRN